MGFLDSFFGGSKSSQTSAISWQQLTAISQLDDLKALSYTQPVLIFKHSTRCSISRMVLRQFEQDFGQYQNTIQPYFLDLLVYRDISNEIAQVFGVVHQSPQVVLLQNGQAVYSASHENIDATVLVSQLR